MDGQDITKWTAPVEQIYCAGDWARIAVGDGGNELGMGKLPRRLISESIRHGETIACRVSCDELIVSGVSNWGAEALLVALSLIDSDRSNQLLARLSQKRQADILRATVEVGGAVDGVLGRSAQSVDGRPASEHQHMLRQMLTVKADHYAQDR